MDGLGYNVICMCDNEIFANHQMKELAAALNVFLMIVQNVKPDIHHTYDVRVIDITNSILEASYYLKKHEHKENPIFHLMHEGSSKVN